MRWIKKAKRERESDEFKKEGVCFGWVTLFMWED